MATRTVTGTILRANGQPWEGAIVRFSMKSSTFTALATFPRDVASVVAGDGTFEVELESGLATRWECLLPSNDRFLFVLEPSDLPVSIEELRAVTGVPTPITSDVQVALDAGFAAFSDELAEATEAVSTLATEVDTKVTADQAVTAVTASEAWETSTDLTDRSLGRDVLALYDTFTRYPDGVLDEQALPPAVGGLSAWVATGANTPTVEDGLLVTGGNGYAVQEVDDPIVMQACDITFSYSNPATTTMTMAICRELGGGATFGDNMVHLNFGPQGGLILLQEDNAAYESVLQVAWSRTVPVGERVRVLLTRRGDSIAVIGPYGETFGYTGPAISTALAGGGNVAFWQPLGGTDSVAVHEVSLHTNASTGYDRSALGTEAVSVLAESRKYRGELVGSPNTSYEVSIGRGRAVNMPTITFGASKITDVLTVQATAGATTIITNHPYPAGSTVQIGNGANQESRTSGAYPGVVPPYTNNLTVALTNTHPVGTPVFVTPPAGVYEMTLSLSQTRMNMASIIHQFRGGEIRLGSDDSVSLAQAGANILRLGAGDTLYIDGTYTAPLRLGNYRLWINATDGKLYKKNGVPASDTDGTVIGTES